MDSAITAGIDARITAQVNYFFTSSYPSLSFSNATPGEMMPAVVLGLAGASLAFFLSMAGAYQAGQTAITQVEASFFSFLETFQDNERFAGESFMDDADRDEGFK